MTTRNDAQPEGKRGRTRRRQLANWTATLAISCAFGIGALGCEDAKTKAAARGTSRERNEMIIASGPSAPTVPAPTGSAAASPAATVLRKICDGQLSKPGRDLSKRPLSRKAAPGAKSPPLALPTGKWQWINLWAAWCAPCKEEMPRLASFTSRLFQAGKDVTLASISLDDDERQLEQFLGASSETGTRSTYWLKEGRERDEWLSAMGLPKAPDLPVQILVDPRGKVRCTVHGAIEDGDYAEILSVVSTP